MTTKSRRATSTRPAPRKLSKAELTRQIIRKLGIAWAVVHRDTHRLVAVEHARTLALKARREHVAARSLKVVRVDLRVHGVRL